MKKSTNEQSFEKLYKEYYQRVYAYLLLLCKNKHLAQDLTQDAFVKVFNETQKGSFDGKFPFAWITTIGKNLFIDYWRNKKRFPYVDPVRNTGEGTVELLNIIPADELNIEQYLIESETRELSYHMIDRLPQKYRSLILSRCKGMQYNDIALAEDIPEGSVKGYIHRARQILMTSENEQLLS